MKNTKRVKEAFAEVLAGARAGAQLSLGALARKAGVEVLRLNAYEAGTMLPELDDLYAIANALDLHPAELLPVLDRDEAGEGEGEDADLKAYAESGEDDEDDGDEDAAA